MFSAVEHLINRYWSDNNSQYSQLLAHTGTIDAQLVEKSLQAVPTKKTVSLLASDTTSDDIDHYIKSKLGAKTDIWIQKSNFLHPGQFLNLKFRSLMITTTLLLIRTSGQ